MCYAIPGKVIEINGESIVVEYGKEKRNAQASLIKVDVGDYVIVSAGFVIKKIPEDEALEVINLILENVDGEVE